MVSLLVPKAALGQANISDKRVEKEGEKPPQQSTNNLKPWAECTFLVLDADITVPQPGRGESGLLEALERISENPSPRVNIIPFSEMTDTFPCL